MALFMRRKHAVTRGLQFGRKLCSFQDLSIDLKITKRLRKYGIHKPTEIQEKCFKALLDENNVVINSETGSGKTLAYALPIMHKVYMDKKNSKKIPRPRALVIVPNVELGYQVGDVFRSMLAAKVCLVTNDLPLRLVDIDVVVSTPQHIMTYPLDVLNETETIILDEADIMIARKVGKHGRKDPLFNLMKHFLSFNPEEGIQSVTERTNQKKQFVFVGATMPDSDHRKSKKSMPYIRSWIPDVVTIRTSAAHKINSTSEMVFLKIEPGNKLKLLIDVINESVNDAVVRDKKTFRTIVYVNSVSTADLLYRQLTTSDRIIVKQSGDRRRDNNEMNNQYGRRSNAIDFSSLLVDFQFEFLDSVFVTHKNVSREERIGSFNSFSSSPRGILITTDVTSRGLDFPDVDVVVQYDFATNVVDILHRAGRTGRMGKQGKVVSFVTERDETLALMVQTKYMDGDSAEQLFSRNRGLPRKLKRLIAEELVSNEERKAWCKSLVCT